MPQSSRREDPPASACCCVLFLFLCLLGGAVYMTVWGVKEIQTTTTVDSLEEDAASSPRISDVPSTPVSWVLPSTELALTLDYSFKNDNLTPSPTASGPATGMATPSTTPTPAPTVMADALVLRAVSSTITTHTSIHTASAVNLAAASSNSHIIRLSHPTPIVTANPNYDIARNESFAVIPWNITLYTRSENQFTVSTNGILSIGGQTASGAPEVYESHSDNYPIADLYTYELVPGTACIWWEELIIPANSTKGIFYQLDGPPGNETLSVEYILNDAQNLLYRFIVEYNQLDPGVITFYYFTNGDSGHNATIGVQGLNSTNGEEAIQYESAGSDFIYNGLIITFDTVEDDCYTEYFNVNCYPASSWPAGIGGPSCH